MNNGRKEILFVFAAVIVIYILAMMSGITCPILFVTGVPCPGCGMTRAWLHFFRGNIHEAFRFHPLFPLPAVLLVLWLFKRRISPKIWNIIMTALIILVLFVWLMRFFIKGDPVVHPDFSNSLLKKLILLINDCAVVFRI